MTGTQYSAPVQEHFRHPRHVGCFAPSEPNVHSAVVGTTATGGIVQLQIQLDDSGIIQATRFRAYGCGATIAAGSYVADTLIGLAPSQARRLQASAIAAALQLPPVKMHCAMLAEDAVKAAVSQVHDTLSQQE